jgi:hypothetical protein
MSLLVGPLALPLLVLAFGACREETATSPQAPSIVAAKGGGAGDDTPVVSKVSPDTVTQGVENRTIVISGSNFDQGSVVGFALDGIDRPDAIATNSTTYKSPKRLEANISVDASAPAVRYDVWVENFRGKRGLGAEKLEVKVSRAREWVPLRATFDDELGDALLNVGEVYVDGEQQIWARGTNNLIFVANTKPKGGDTPRTAFLAFGELSGSPTFAGPIHFDIRTFFPGQSAGGGLPYMDLGEQMVFGLRLYWKADGLYHRLRFNTWSDTEYEACGGDGVVPNALEGEEVVVTQLEDDPTSGGRRWRVDVLKGAASGGNGAVYCTAEEVKGPGKGRSSRGPFRYMGHFDVPFGLVVEEID